MEIDDNVRSALYPIAPKIYERLSNSLHRARNILSESEHLRNDGQLYSSFNQFFEMFNALENQATPYQLHRPLAKRLHSEVYSFIQNIDAIPPRIIGILQDLASKLMIAIEDSRTNELDEQTKEQIRHLLERNRKLLEDTQLSVQNRVDEGSEAIRSTLQSVRDELDTHANRAEIQIQNLVSKADHQNKLHRADLKESFKAYEEEAANRIEVRIQRAEGIAASLSKQATDAKELYENIISEEKESLHTFITESQSTVNDSIRKTAADASQRIQNAQTDAQESFDGHLNEIIGTINKRIDDKISHYDEMKKEMEAAFQDKIQTLDRQLSIVTSGVMADQHLKQANTERYVYWLFQVAGFAFMLAAIYAGSVFFSELTNIKIPFLPKPDLVIHVDGSLNNGASPISLMFMRLSMIILLTAPALYLLKEAAGHRHKENLYRQRGIQLATISPYLEELEKEERAAIKKELVSSFFNFHDGKADTQNVPDFLRDMKEAVGIAKSLNGQNKTVSQRFGRQPKQ
ncbi:hypothetical protein VCR26J2_370224 [Vibrio coralliirubri]|uniref:hypothetical protein n=1 Tax=Vibrio coralliirubri TaxID=1516159 RepID=UPI00063385C6|nr:hypothetical protein [Vibrio coralliirubri]CDT75946.1 hypothetical protein VCR26J2_370224 [Vibrio coralliirubri]